MAVLLISHRRKLTHSSATLRPGAKYSGWHTSNLIITLHSLFGLNYNQWTTTLRLADTVAVISITLAYSFLLHVHVHLWANVLHGRLQARKNFVFTSRTCRHLFDHRGAEDLVGRLCADAG